MMWNIDSLDWSDPIPESIAMRVLHELSQRQKGIVLFHDTQPHTAAMLPEFLRELKRRNYRVVHVVPGPIPH